MVGSCPSTNMAFIRWSEKKTHSGVHSGRDAGNNPTQWYLSSEDMTLSRYKLQQSPSGSHECGEDNSPPLYSILASLSDLHRPPWISYLAGSGV